MVSRNSFVCVVLSMLSTGAVGVCNLCNGTVRFIAPRDTKDVFKFCSLQSPAGRVLLNQHNITREDANSSIVLIDGEKVYRKSTAVLRILKDLKWPWPVLYASTLIPSFIRDPCYNFIARNRYR